MSMQAVILRNQRKHQMKKADIDSTVVIICNNNLCLLFIHNVPEASASLKTSAKVAAAVNFCTVEVN